MRRSSFIAAAALASLAPGCAPSQAEREADVAPYVDCRSEPGIAFTGEGRMAVTCPQSGANALVDGRTMVVGYGFSNRPNESLIMNVVVPDADGNRYCVGRVTVLTVERDGEQLTTAIPFYTVIDADARQQAIINRRPIPQGPVAVSPANLPGTPECANGLEARTNAALNVLVRLAGRANDANTAR